MGYLDEGRSYIHGTGNIFSLGEGSAVRKARPKFPIGFRVSSPDEKVSTKKPKRNADVGRLSAPKKGA